MKIDVIGTGADSGYFGGKLANAGQDLSLPVKYSRMKRIQHLQKTCLTRINRFARVLSPFGYSSS